MSLPFNIRADLTLSYFVILFFNYLQGLHVLPSSIHFVIFKNSFLLNHEDPRDVPHTTGNNIPKYVPDKLLAREIVYQTVEKGATAYLSEKNKKYWPIFPIQVGSYSLVNKKQDEKEVEALKEICLYLGEPKSHDPWNVVYEHMKVVKLAPQTMHESRFSEDVF
jgi:hypothetical protein